METSAKMNQGKFFDHPNVLMLIQIINPFQSF